MRKNVLLSLLLSYSGLSFSLVGDGVSIIKNDFNNKAPLAYQVSTDPCSKLKINLNNYIGTNLKVISKLNDVGSGPSSLFYGDQGHLFLAYNQFTSNGSFADPRISDDAYVVDLTQLTQPAISKKLAPFYSEQFGCMNISMTDLNNGLLGATCKVRADARGFSVDAYSRDYAEIRTFFTPEYKNKKTRFYGDKSWEKSYFNDIIHLHSDKIAMISTEYGTFTNHVFLTMADPDTLTEYDAWNKYYNNYDIDKVKDYIDNSWPMKLLELPDGNIGIVGSSKNYKIAIIKYTTGGTLVTTSTPGVFNHNGQLGVTVDNNRILISHVSHNLENKAYMELDIFDASSFAQISNSRVSMPDDAPGADYSWPELIKIEGTTKAKLAYEFKSGGIHELRTVDIDLGAIMKQSSNQNSTKPVMYSSPLKISGNEVATAGIHYLTIENNSGQSFDLTPTLVNQQDRNQNIKLWFPKFTLQAKQSKKVQFITFDDNNDKVSAHRNYKIDLINRENGDHYEFPLEVGFHK